MLEYLRNGADKPFAKFLMFVLIAVFVYWGVSPWIFSSGMMSDSTLVRVGRSDVSLQQYNVERSNQLSAMSREDQRSVYADPAKTAALSNAVIAKLTMNQLALNRAKDLGFVVSDKRIAEEIKSHPQFQVNGEFQPWMFDAVLRNSGLSENDIANSLRANILYGMTLGATNVPVSVPGFAVDAAYNARYATRDIKYATVKYSDYKVGNPTTEELQAYYVQNPVIVPETRSVSYVFVAADMNKPDLYDEGFKKAQTIEDMIISGDSLKTAADHGGAKYVSLAKIKRGDKLNDKILSDELVARLFVMDSGNESELIELKDGFIILRVDEIHAQHNAEFKDVEKSLVNDWKKSQQRKQAYIDANEKLIAMKDSKPVNNIKDAVITRTDGAPLVVLNAAFAGKTGDSFITEDNNAFYVVNVGKSVMPKADKAKKESVRKEMEKMTNRFIQDDYTRFLKKQYPVKVNEKVYNKFILK